MPYVRNKNDGYVLISTPHLEANPDYERISDEEAAKAIGKKGAAPAVEPTLPPNGPVVKPAAEPQEPAKKGGKKKPAAE